MTMRQPSSHPLQFRVKVPATSANLGPGFDCMGLALELFNEIVVETEVPFSIEMTGESAHMLPGDRTNAVVQAMDTLLAKIGSKRVPTDWRLRQHNAIPVAAGLGSSASAIVGGLLVANAMVEHYDPDAAWTRQALLDLAIEMEGHPDNVTPAMLGGAWLSVVDALHTQSYPLPLPEQLVFSVAVPEFPLRTEDARRVLPSQISRTDAIWNTAQASRLTLALCTGNLKLLSGGFDDRLHEPYRRKLIPGFDEVRQAAIRVGAITTTLSGAGPSVLAWCESEEIAASAADEMKLAWHHLQIECRTYVLKPCRVETRTEKLEDNVY
jgi:homoserine kinase